MRKLYSILYVFAAIFVTSCNDEDRVVNLKNEDPNMTITDISPNNGYVGDELTIYGTDFGVSEDLVKVFIGSNLAEVLSCEDGTIVAKIADNTTTGKVSLEILGHKVTSDIFYTVLGQPGVTEISPAKAFIGDEISFIGSDFGTEKSRVTVLFPGVETPAEVVTCENEKIVVKVPEGAISGELSMTISAQSVNMPTDFTVLKRAMLEALSPAKGYMEGNVSISGANFGDSSEGATVFFNSIEADIVEWTDTYIVVKVPANLIETAIPAEGTEVDVQVSTPYETIETLLVFTVLPAPVISEITPGEFYVGSELTIKGQNLGQQQDNVQIFFGEQTEPAKITAWSTTEIKVKVPQGLTEGDIKVNIQLLNRNVGRTLKVLPSPTITGISFPNVLNENGLSDNKVVVGKGEDITITGNHFGTSADAVKIYIDNEETADLSIKSIANEQIVLTVGDGFAGGELKLYYEGLPVIDTEKALIMVKAGDDITEYVLENYKAPFETLTNDEGEEIKKDDWRVPAVWNVNKDAKSVSGTDDTVGGMHNSGVLLLQAGWGCRSGVTNGQIYQNAVLPAGTYKVELNVTEVAVDKGTLNMYFIVTSGTNLPTIKESYHTPDVSEGKGGSYQFVKGETGARGFTFSLSEDTEVAIGFAGFLRQSACAKVSSIAIIKQ